MRMTSKLIDLFERCVITKWTFVEIPTQHPFCFKFMSSAAQIPIELNMKAGKNFAECIQFSFAYQTSTNFEPTHCSRRLIVRSSQKNTISLHSRSTVIPFQCIQLCNCFPIKSKIRLECIWSISHLLKTWSAKLSPRNCLNSEAWRIRRAVYRPRKSCCVVLELTCEEWRNYHSPPTITSLMNQMFVQKFVQLNKFELIAY